MTVKTGDWLKDRWLDSRLDGQQPSHCQRVCRKVHIPEKHQKHEKKKNVLKRHFQREAEAVGNCSEKKSCLSVEPGELVAGWVCSVLTADVLQWKYAFILVNLICIVLVVYLYLQFSFLLRKDKRWCCATNCVWALFSGHANSCVASSNICNFFDRSGEQTVQRFKGNDADLRPNRLALSSGPPRIHLITLNKHRTCRMPKWKLRIHLLDNCHANYNWQLLQNQIHICYSCDLLTSFKLAPVMHFWAHGNVFNSGGDAYGGFKYSFCSWTELTWHLKYVLQPHE